MTLSIAPTTKMSSAAAEEEMRQVLDSRLQGEIELLVTLEYKRGLQGGIELLVTLE